MEKVILITNDDGIYSPGIMALFETMSELGKVFIVAPLIEQSAVGHAITISDPIKIKFIERNSSFKGYGVSGTPADCVKLAINVILDCKPDIVVSGINRGPNVGISVIYSGTVSAATEGTILGIPSVAISLGSFTNPIWETAQYVAKIIVKKMLVEKVPKDVLLNINIPNLPLSRIKGFKITKMGKSRFKEIFHKRTNPAGDVYYWLDGELEIIGNSKGTDIDALRKGYVSITPISYNLTNHNFMLKLKRWFFSKL